MFATFARAVRKIEEKDLFFLIGILIVVLGSWAFFELAHEVVTGGTLPFDQWLLRAFRTNSDLSVPIGPAWLIEASRDITALGGYAVLILLVAIVAGFLHLDGKAGAMRFLLGAVISGYVLGMALKAIVARPRPHVVPYLSPAYNTSFPSGHSMMSAIVYLTLGALFSRFATNLPRLRLYFIIVALLLSGLVGVSRIYLGVHYPTDVLAGWTAGVVWATLCSLIAQRLQRRGVVESGL